ncbi:hypothetical protein OWR28_10010 [Chryseobacterium sp. 1B4]
MMSLTGKYAAGILLTFILLAAAMLYSNPAITLITGIRKITADHFFQQNYTVDHFDYCIPVQYFC